MISETSLYKRPKEPIVAKLSLISLMDIFTILVFFLMLNSGETQNIDVDRFVELPDSSSGTTFQDQLSILIDKDHLVYNDEVIVTTEDILKTPQNKIEPLSEILMEHAASFGDVSKEQKDRGFAITILADRSVSYEILKSVMETCREQNYRNISLAVNQIVEPISANDLAKISIFKELESE